MLARATNCRPGSGEDAARCSVASATGRSTCTPQRRNAQSGSEPPSATGAVQIAGLWRQRSRVLMLACSFVAGGLVIGRAAGASLCGSIDVLSGSAKA